MRLIGIENDNETEVGGENADRSCSAFSFTFQATFLISRAFSRADINR